MTPPQDWASKKVARYETMAWGPGPYIQPDEAARLLRAEHRGAVGIVMKARRIAYENDLKLFKSSAALDGYIEACTDILAALTRGRGKGEQ